MSTNRADLTSGVSTMMAAFIAAQPTLLKRHFSFRPTTALTDWPCSWLEMRRTTIAYANGLRDMLIYPSIVFVDAELDPTQTTNRLDTIQDAFTDHFDSYAHLVTGSVVDAGEWNDEAVPLGGETFAAGIRFSFGPVTFKNGRP